MKLADIEFDGSIKALKPCRRCGCAMGEIHPPKGPHGNMLRCAGCGNFHNWLSPTHPKAILPEPKRPWVPHEDDLIDEGDLFE
jgi:hypothetical protein